MAPIRDPSGTVVALTAFPQVPSQQVARFVSEFFRGITPFEGYIQVESSTPITVIAVRQSSSGLFSALPSVPVTGVSEGRIFWPSRCYIYVGGRF